MTVSSTQGYIKYTGDGSTQTFAVPFYFILNTDLAVSIFSSDGTITELTYGVDYDATGGGDESGGSVTLKYKYGKSDTIFIDRQPPVTQETKYYENGKFPAKSHERALDKITMLIQRYLQRYDFLYLQRENPLSDHYDAENYLISNLRNPVNPQDAATMAWALNEISKVVVAGSTDMQALSDTTSLALGDALIGVKQPFTGATPRTQHQKNADVLNVLDFGVVPNSEADQSSSILLAISAANGGTLIFPKGVYIASLGTLNKNVTLIGQGATNTIIKRPASSSAGIVTFSGSGSYVVRGVCFDGNKLNNITDADNIVVASSVVNFEMVSCRSTGSKGKNGITIGTAIADIVANGVAYIEKCRFDNNDYFGAKITKRNQVNFTNNECDSNGDNGLSVDNVVFPPVAQSQQRVTITNNHLHHNISAGCFITGYTDGGTAEAPLYGNNKNANYKFIVSNNQIHYNKRYGLAVQANEFTVTSNVCTNNGEYSSPVAGAYAGILINGSNGTITGNTIRNNTGYGMDLGGTQYFTCNDNFVIENGSQTGGGFVGINLGGCQYGTVSGNTCVLNGPSGYGTQILVPGYDGGVTSFPTLTNAINITGNTCILGNASSRVGIRLYGRALNCSVTNNKFSGGNQNTAIAIETNEPAFVSGNNHEDSSTNLALLVIANNAAITFPDFVENVHITGGATNTNFLTYSHNIFRGKVSEAVVINQGSGYNPLNVPAVTISGGGGSGATAVAAVDGSGKVISVNITNAGSGYTSAPTITISPPASGTTATANARIGVINFQGRKWTFFYDTASTIQSGNNIQLPGATTSLSVPANGVVSFMGTESGRFLLAGKSF